MKKQYFLCVVFGVWLASTTALGQSAIDPSASVVDLRSSCAMPLGATLDNCFETTADLTDWLWNGGRTSEPNMMDPVKVRVGPGTFDEFDCDGTGMRGFVSVEGAGRDVTRFVTPVTPIFDWLTGACRGGVTAFGCTNLSFRDVTIEGAAGVLWTGDGDSEWQDVDMRAENPEGVTCLSEAFPWYDTLSAGGLHFFWNCRFEATGVGAVTNAFRNNAAEIWAYGSDFLVRRTGSQGGGGTPAAVQTAGAGGMRIFGSTVRGFVDASAAGNSVIGVLALGEFHMHGGIISMNGTAHPSGGVVIGISASGIAHTPDTAFALLGATKIRVTGTGNIMSPFWWESGPTPPNISSRTGYDLFVKTNEGVGGDEPRLLVYDSGCSPDPWRRVSNDTCL